MSLVDWGLWHTQTVLPRPITLWLPDQAPPPWNVLWAHDGQNLFYPERAFLGQTWDMHQTLAHLIATHEIAPTMVVGIGNTSERLHEYMPRAGGEAYLQFLVEELRPAILSQFPVRTDGHVLIGSSMGGLISAYGVCRYPELFAGAACLSTHWPAGGGLGLEILREELPEAGSHRWYFDYGTETADAPYEGYQLRVDHLMNRRGYRRGRDWETLKFPGADHSERAWRERLHLPLKFLL